MKSNSCASCLALKNGCSLQRKTYTMYWMNINKPATPMYYNYNCTRPKSVNELRGLLRNIKFNLGKGK